MHVCGLNDIAVRVNDVKKKEVARDGWWLILFSQLIKLHYINVSLVIIRTDPKAANGFTLSHQSAELVFASSSWPGAVSCHFISLSTPPKLEIVLCRV